MQLKDKKYKYLKGVGLKVGIVVARFNGEITDGLLASALQELKKSEVAQNDIRVIYVAGSVEVPYALHKLAQSGQYDLMVAIGCVIRGETPHFDYVCKMAQEGVLKVMIEDNIPVGFGVITVNNLKQAKARLHVGGEAALAAIELALMK